MASEPMAAVIAGITSSSDLTCALAERAAKVAGVSGLGAVLTGSAESIESFWSAGPTDSALQDLQLTLGEGPSVDAARHGVPVLEPDLSGTPADRWPAFTGAAGELGVRALFAFPLRIGAIGLGVLLLHRDSPGSMTSAQTRDALVLADALTSLVLRLFADGEFMVLHAAVHQATGMIAVQMGVGLDEALVRLRGYAFGNDRPIEEVAAEIVARRLDITNSP